MMRVRTLGAALLAIFALGVIVVSGAQAEAPRWSRCAAKKEKPCKEYLPLKLGEKLENSVSGGPWTLGTGKEAPGVECGSVTAAKGAALLGSEAGVSGSSEEVLIFKTCKPVNNGAACTIPEETITTEKLTDRLDRSNKAPVVGEYLLLSFKPAKGASFVKLKFAGTCTIKETTIELKGGATLGVAGILDLERECNPAENEEAKKQEEEKKPELAELCKTKHAPLKLSVNEELQETMLITFPKTLAKVEWVDEGKGKEPVEVKEGLVSFGKAVTEFKGHGQITIPEVDWGVFNK